MTYLENFRRVTELCRICTSYSEKINHFHDEIAPRESSSTVLEVLEKMLSVKINEDPKYPRLICKPCSDRLWLSYDFKEIFAKSQSILEKYISLNENLQNDSESTEPVEIIKLEVQESFTEKLSSDENISDNDEVLDSDDRSLNKHSNQNVNDSIEYRDGTQPDISEDTIKVDLRVLRSKYKCTNCSKRCLTADILKNHMQTCPDNGTYECDFCTVRLDTKKQKSTHIGYHHRKRAYKCNLCDEVFYSSGTVWYHKNRVHSTRMFPCQICGKTFHMKNSYKKHLNTHNKDVAKVVCQICGKGFHYESGLFYHMRVHKDIRKYTCTFCPKRFLTMSGLKRHVRTHTGERPYYCSFCAKSFSSLAEVKTHERRHTGQKPHICIYCKKDHITLYNLRLHMSTHQGTYPCDLCHKCYLNAHVLKLHMKYKHNIKDEVKIDNVEED